LDNRSRVSNGGGGTEGELSAVWDRIEIERVMYGVGCTVFAVPYFMTQKKKGLFI